MILDRHFHKNWGIARHNAEAQKNGTAVEKVLRAAWPRPMLQTPHSGFEDFNLDFKLVFVLQGTWLKQNK